MGTCFPAVGPAGRGGMRGIGQTVRRRPPPPVSANASRSWTFGRRRQRRSARLNNFLWRSASTQASIHKKILPWTAWTDNHGRRELTLSWTAWTESLEVFPQSTIQRNFHHFACGNDYQSIWMCKIGKNRYIPFRRLKSLDGATQLYIIQGISKINSTSRVLLFKGSFGVP